MSVRAGDQQPDLFSQAGAGRAEDAGMSLAIGDDAIARIEFDAPGSKVNLLTTAVMERLDALLTEVRANGSVKGLLFRSAKPGTFIAGADIDEIEGITDPGEGEGKARRGQQVFQRIADLAVPTVAAIDGACLGGGLELALACDFRVASDGPKVRIGLPEVKLGILPGFGGTQRLPALIGLSPALDLILSGAALDARRALELGVVDRVVPAVHLDAQAAGILKQAVARVPSLRAPDGGLRDWRAALGLAPRKGAAGRLLGRTRAASWLAGLTARRRLAARVDEGRYPAAFFALRAAVAGARLGLARGLDNEARLLGELIATKTSKNLIFLHKARAEAASDPGVAGPVPPLRAISKAGVVGAGTMGAGIAAALAGAGLPVRMRDLSWERLAQGIGAGAATVERELRRGTIDPRAAAARRAAVSATTDWSGFRPAELVVEAVDERLEAKREVFARLEELCGAGAILASNTSSLTIAEIAATARRPDRIVGLHFFHPVDRTALVEVIATRATDRAVTATAVALVKRLGKTPIVVRDGPGFLVNRVLMPYLGEALLMFEEGARVEELDAELRGFGMPSGPFELLDAIGLDVAAAGRAVPPRGVRRAGRRAAGARPADGGGAPRAKGRERLLPVRPRRRAEGARPRSGKNRRGGPAAPRSAARRPAGGKAHPGPGAPAPPDDQRGGDGARRRRRAIARRRGPRARARRRLPVLPRGTAAVRGFPRDGEHRGAARAAGGAPRQALRAGRSPARAGPRGQAVPPRRLTAG